MTASGPPRKERRKSPLGSSVRASLELYFKDLDGYRPDNLHKLVMSEVERPLLESTLRFVSGNQSRAAELLGISRGTLAKKLKLYKIS